jgi:hypothetical protein
MFVVAIMGLVLGGSISAYRWGMREICLVEARHYRASAVETRDPITKAEYDKLAERYESRYRSYGGSR